MNIIRDALLLHIGNLSALRPRIFSRALGCGARRGPACTLRHKPGPRLGSVARGLGAQSRASWEMITGSVSASPSLARQWKPHDLRLLLSVLLLLCITPSLKLSSSLLRGSHGTTVAVAHQALPFLMATDGASVCVRVCAVFPVDLGNTSRNEHIISRGAMHWMLHRG